MTATKHTLHDRLVAGLLALGWSKDHTDKSRYDAFMHPKRQAKLFVGTNGALRSGECASRSFSIGDAARQTPAYSHYLAAGDAALVVKSPQGFEAFE